MGKIIKLREKDINFIVKKVINEERYILDEQAGTIILLSTGLLLWRQSAKQKAKRLTRKIKNDLRDAGIKSKIIAEGNLNKLMKCINGIIDGEENVLPGKKRMSKSLVRRKKGTRIFDAAFEKFKINLPTQLKACGRELGIDDESLKTISEVIIDTIEDFATGNLLFRML
jgi:hypothetical protein